MGIGRILLIAVTVKGIIIGTSAVLLNIDFIRALIIAFVSATVTGLFGALIQWMNDRSHGRVEARLESLEHQAADVARHTGTVKRSTDPRGEEC